MIRGNIKDQQFSHSHRSAKRSLRRQLRMWVKEAIPGKEKPVEEAEEYEEDLLGLLLCEQKKKYLPGWKERETFPGLWKLEPETYFSPHPSQSLSLSISCWSFQFFTPSFIWIEIKTTAERGTLKTPIKDRRDGKKRGGTKEKGNWQWGRGRKRGRDGAVERKIVNKRWVSAWERK